MLGLSPSATQHSIMTAREPERRILLTGATGYVGGRLLDVLESRGLKLRCLARQPAFLLPRVATSTQVVSGDVFDRASLDAALRGVHTAYYLVHSMGAAGDFVRSDRTAAANFAAAAKQAGVRRIVYLGGLGDGTGLSKHLRSRQEVGHILRESGVPTFEFRASIIIGSGSVSFEMIRALVEKLPVMITPRWVRVKAQPIAIDDVVEYLAGAVDLAHDESIVFEVGGSECVSYGDIMKQYALQRRLRRVMIPVPVLTPALSSLWLGLVTPIYARIGRKLVDSLRNPTFVNDDSALQAFPIRPMGVAEAISRALQNEDREFALTRWSDAVSSPGIASRKGATRRSGRRIVDSRTARVAVPAKQAFRPIRQVGGMVGWYYANWLWRLRGFIDLLLGGVGSRRGRRHPEWLLPGETVDFWRVEAVEPDRLLRLRAEMKLPGRAWLQFEVENEDEGARITQTAVFDPVGLAGLLYWYALYPIHTVMFAGMLQAIAREATLGH